MTEDSNYKRFLLREGDATFVTEAEQLHHDLMARSDQIVDEAAAKAAGSSAVDELLRRARWGQPG